MARPTLRTIADKLGVSTATVSLAMRDSKKISTGMRSRVKAALVEEGYVYQRSAAGLRTSRTDTVGVIVNNISDPFIGTLFASLEVALAKTGRTVFLCNTDESVARQTDFIRRMSEYNADGIIVCPAIRSTSRDFHPKRGAIPPLVFVSRTMLDLDFDHVVNDDYEATVLSMNHLLSMGHRRIAFVGGDPSVSGFQERLRGYRAAAGACVHRLRRNARQAIHPDSPGRLSGGTLDCGTHTQADRGNRLQRRGRAWTLFRCAARGSLSGQELCPHRPRRRRGGEPRQSTTYRDDGFSRRDGQAGGVGAHRAYRAS